ncbi:hypothetical protein M9Y10_030221 [Tritrichomonas musculus]|uniref:Uncharacterized protein n=1 Tax=Tritrichomonas musculus TaxID=1915356 RepID=A0ABR2KRE5_9EUKA
MIPCIHQLSLPYPAAIPKPPKVSILFKNQWEELIDRYLPSQELKKDKKAFEKEEMNYVVNLIKFYSRFMGKEIETFVDKNYTRYLGSDSDFILNKPASFLKLVDDGIRYSKTLKNMKKEEK